MESNPLIPCTGKNCKNFVRPPLTLCKGCTIIAGRQEERRVARLSKLEAKIELKSKIAQERAIVDLEVKEAIKRTKQNAVSQREQNEKDSLDDFDNSESCALEDVRDLLRERRLLTKDYIAEACFRQGIMAARRLRIIPNRYFWTHGVLSTLESLQQKQPVHVLPLVEDAKALNEQCRNQDRLALWDFSTSWREQDACEDVWGEGHRITFEEYEALRALKGDAVSFGNLFFETDFEDMHRGWQAFLPSIPTDGLPEKYTQKEFKAALARLSEIREFLLTAFRSSFKSTFLRTWIVCFILCFPSVRVLCASATATLATDVLKVMRGFFVVDNDEPTLLQQVFADFCLYTRDDFGSVKTYECPARQLKGLAQPTLFSCSLESTVAGKRFDLLWGDDCSDNTNSDSVTTREATWRRWSLLKELREGAGASLILLSGTPYSRGDLLDKAIQLNSLSSEKSLAVLMDPAFEILDETRRRELAEKPQLYYQLAEHEVKMRFPQQFSWKEFKKALASADLKEILQQKLLIWTADGEVIPLQFQREKFEACWVNNAPPREGARLLLGVDRAFSTSKYADRSSISAVLLHQNLDNKPAACVLDVIADRWQTSVLAEKIVEMYIKHRPDMLIIERDSAWHDLSVALQSECDQKGMELNIFWHPPTTTPKAKIIRFKQQESLMATKPLPRLTFLRGDHCEEIWREMSWQDGVRISSTSNNRKDDILDSISQCLLVMPDPDSSSTDENRRTTEAETKFLEDERRRKQYLMVFGRNDYAQNNYNHEPTAPPPENLDDGLARSPIHRALKQGDKIKENPKPYLSFSSAPRVNH